MAASSSIANSWSFFPNNKCIPYFRKRTLRKPRERSLAAFPTGSETFQKEDGMNKPIPTKVHGILDHASIAWQAQCLRCSDRQLLNHTIQFLLAPLDGEISLS